jgi:hypothetical protein
VFSEHSEPGQALGLIQVQSKSVYPQEGPGLQSCFCHVRCVEMDQSEVSETFLVDSNPLPHLLEGVNMALHMHTKNGESPSNNWGSLTKASKLNDFSIETHIVLGIRNFQKPPFLANHIIPLDLVV